MKIALKCLFLCLLFCPRTMHQLNCYTQTYFPSSPCTRCQKTGLYVILLAYMRAYSKNSSNTAFCVRIWQIHSHIAHAYINALNAPRYSTSIPAYKLTTDFSGGYVLLIRSIHKTNMLVLLVSLEKRCVSGEAIAFYPQCCLEFRVQIHGKPLN